jgi:4'-phosphopantetheinyl transferase
MQISMQTDFLLGEPGLELLRMTTTRILPPLRSWSKKSSNLCISDEILTYWQNNDIITVLADIGMYDKMLYNTLDTAEKEQERELKSAYFKKRFVVSRSVLKNILFAGLGMQNTVLIRDKNGRVRVRNRPDIFISLSYSGPCIAVTVGKRKIGSDIEIVRPVGLRKIRSSPLFDGVTSGDGEVDNQHLLHVWTLLEAYAKFHDISLYPMIKDRFFSPDTHFVSYLIDQRFILSLASDSDALNDTLLWIDPACRLVPSSAGKKAACSPSRPDGDTYVRA